MKEWNNFDLVYIQLVEAAGCARSLERTSSDPIAPLKILPDEKVTWATIVLT